MTNQIVERTATTREGEIQLRFCSSKCAEEFLQMPDNDQYQIALSRLLWVKQYQRQLSRCELCGEKL